MLARTLARRRAATRVLLSLLAVGWLLLVGCKCTSGLLPKRTEESTSKPDSCVEQYYVDRHHVCARMRDGSYRCRGDNRYQQLTHGVWSGLPPPQDDLRAFPGGWDEIVIGPIMYATKAGELHVWGHNGNGAITWDAPEHLAAPMVEPVFPKDLVRFAARSGNLWCGIDQQQQVFCRQTRRDVFQVEDAPSNVAVIDVASAGICVSPGHGVWCYAHPLLWQEEDTELHPEAFGAPGTRFISVLDIPDDQRIVEIKWPCARTERGEIWCWGPRGERQLKGQKTPCLDCSPEYFRTATKADLPLAKDLARDALVDQDGYVWAWTIGAGLGDVARPSGDDPAVRLDAAGSDNAWVSFHIHSYCVRKSSGELICLGENDLGQFTGPDCARGKVCGPTLVEFTCR